MDKQFCIFDLDGTLVDSMRHWNALGHEYLQTRGVTPDEPFSWLGMTMLEAGAYFMQRFAIPGPPAQIVRDMEAMMAAHYARDVPLKDGIADYLQTLKTRGARLCVATATAADLAQACLQRLGLDTYFDFILSCESIGVSKHAPDLYLLCAEKFGVQPAHAAVFEDALYAAETAKRAGFYTVGVQDASCLEEWPQLVSLCDETITDWRNST